jgi:filamentous hemagglutinin family protein
MSKPSVLFISVLLLFSANLYAEVVTDGSLGPAQNLQGPDYQIGADLGEQHGPNLFHSFQKFNLESNDSATFSGPNTIENVISRVTGGNPSNIDGTIRSLIPNADFFFLNPYGIVFGPNASLDVPGSFHASTAHYLLLGENERFYSSLGNESILSVASPTAFGFLGNETQSIEVNQSSLTVNKDKMLSLVGGDLIINEATLFAESGQINLVAVGDVETLIPFTASELAQKTFGLQGEIRLTMSESKAAELWENDLEEKPVFGNIDVSGDGGGQVFIRGGQFYAKSGFIFADTYGDRSDAGIDIAVEGEVILEDGAIITAENDSGSSVGQITINAKEALILSGINEQIADKIKKENRDADLDELLESASGIFTDNLGTGTGGDIRITTPSLSIDTGLIGTATRGSGKAGDIWIDAFQIELDRNGIIEAQTVGDGQGGTLTIRATEALSLTGDSILSVASEGSGNTGHIEIETSELALSDYSEINSFSFLTGGGNITLNVRDRLHMTDNSWIIANTFGGQKQDSGGNITIGNPKIFILDKGQILAGAVEGDGGKIEIHARHFIPSYPFDIRGEVKNIQFPVSEYEEVEINRIDASSEAGQDGEVWINSSEKDISKDLARLPQSRSEFTFSLDRCAGVTRDTISKFLITIRDVLPPGPGDLMTDNPF